MNADLVQEIVDIGDLLAVETRMGGSLKYEELKSILKKLVFYGLELFEDHTGEPLFPDRISEEDPV